MQDRRDGARGRWSFLLDNGYISDQALANVRRVVDKLGLELVVGETPAMPAIFADSLERFSNVCNGCFKTIYTLAMNLAHERGIRHIVTGLSRGQLLETRVADLLRRRVYDPERIEETILAARKTYHRIDDAVSRNLDVRIFEDDAVLDSIEFVDFYRYVDVPLEELLRYIGEHTPWIRPSDTGRSTNCRINEAGIYVHKMERGFHNYSEPYSWDVRLGHKQRDEALAELDDRIDVSVVQGILQEVGYRPKPRSRPDGLTAYYVSPRELSSSELRAFLSKTLPQDVLPTAFVRLERMPLTINGKIDRDALPHTPAGGSGARASPGPARNRGRTHPRAGLARDHGSRTDQRGKRTSSSLGATPCRRSRSWDLRRNAGLLSPPGSVRPSHDSRVGRGRAGR